MYIGFKKVITLKRKKIKGMVSERSVAFQLLQMLCILLFIIILHTIAMILFEGMSFGDAVWLTMTSATTVGYGDLSANTLMGRVSTVILLYIGGIAILAQVAAMCFEHRQEIREKKLQGNWSWKMKDHIVFLNYPDKIGDEYFYNDI